MKNSNQQAEPLPHTDRKRRMLGGRILNWARNLVVIALCAAFGWYLYTHSQQLEILWSMPIWVLALIVGLRLISYLASVEAVTRCASVFVTDLQRMKILLLFSSGSIMTTIALPFAGYALKTAYFKSRHGLRHRDFLVINAVLGLWSLCISAILALGALFLLQWSGHNFDMIIWLITGAMLLSPLPLFMPRLPLPRFILLAPLHELHASARTLMAHRKNWGRVGTALLIRGIGNFIGFGLVFAFLAGPRTSLLLGGLVDSLSSILRYVKILPGNLGLYEWIVAALSATLGKTLIAGILSAAVNRVAGLIAYMICMAIGLLYYKLESSCAASDKPEIRKFL